MTDLTPLILEDFGITEEELDFIVKYLTYDAVDDRVDAAMNAIPADGARQKEILLEAVLDVLDGKLPTFMASVLEGKRNNTKRTLELYRRNKKSYDENPWARRTKV